MGKHLGEGMPMINVRSSEFIRGYLAAMADQPPIDPGGYVMNQPNAGEEIKRRCFAEMAKDSNLTYDDAFQRVTMADRDLTGRYFSETRDQILQGAEIKVGSSEIFPVKA